MSASPDEQSVTANHIALAAAILAASAFVVAILQVIAQYVSSSEARFKCNRAAIDEAGKSVQRGWSWRQWKMKLYYPELTFGCMEVLKAAANNEMNGITVGLSLDVEKEKSYGWRSLATNDVPQFSHVCDGKDCLVKTSLGGSFLVKASDLDWKDWFRFWWWRARHRAWRMRRPRATWSQMLLALGITDTKSITRQTIDADSIPYGFDVPAQHIRLFDLGVLALVLGFASVSIDVQNRDFTAVGPSATITTEEFPGFGKVIRFDGDIFEIHALISRCNRFWLVAAANYVNGKMRFSKYTCNGFFLPLGVVSNAIQNNETAEAYENNQTKLIGNLDDEAGSRGNLPGEASHFHELYTSELQARIRAIHGAGSNPSNSILRQAFLDWEIDQKYGDMYKTVAQGLDSRIENADYQDILVTAISQWQRQTKSRMPTLFVAATFCSVSGILVAFPARLLLRPFLQWFKLEAFRMHQNLGRTFKISEAFQKAVADGSIPWVREISDFLMCFSIGTSYDGLFSWGTGRMDNVLKGLSDAIISEIAPGSLPEKPSADVDQSSNHVPSSGDGPGITRDNTSNPEDIPSGVESSSPTQNSTPNQGAIELQRLSSLNNQSAAPPQVCTILMPHTISLLRDFDPIGWASKISASTQFVAYKRYNVKNLLWAQVVLLDLTIRLIIREGKLDKLDDRDPGNDKMDELRGETWEMAERKVVAAIVKGWELADFDESPTTGSHDPHHGSAQWNLAADLEEHSGINFGDDPDIVKRRFRELEDLLKIRALFVIALLLLGPDSSDVYQAENSNAEMPMI